MDNIYFVVWFFLPAGLANASAALSTRIPIIGKWNYPIDLYKEYKGVRIFGDHKTIRGLLTGVIIGSITLYLQLNAFSDISFSFEQIDYHSVKPLLLGSLMGAGALMGDAVKSFFKRRQNLKPGAAWFPYDQVDYIIGSSLFSMSYIQLDLYYYVLYVFIGVLAHILTNIVGYLLGLKDVPY